MRGKYDTNAPPMQTRLDTKAHDQQRWEEGKESEAGVMNKMMKLDLRGDIDIGIYRRRCKGQEHKDKFWEFSNLEIFHTT